MFDLISIGDTTLDVFMQIKDATVTCDINHDACQVCVGFGEKIPVEEIHTVYAVGNAPNVAVGNSRLGLRTALYTIFGNDDAGQQMIHALQNEKVANDYFVIDKKKPSDYSVVLRYNGERTILVYHEERAYKMPKLKPASWMFLGSIGQDPQYIHNSVVRYVKKHEAKLVFNPGPVQFRLGFEALCPILKQTHLLIVNKQEAQTILQQTHPQKDARRLAEKFHSLGVTNVIITDGGNGSTAFDGEQYYHIPSFAKKIVESTGAGDSFTTGCIAGLFHTGDLAQAMAWGAHNATSVLQYIGAQAGLLTLREMKAAIRKHPRVKTKLLK
jgi:sugar/nucleoside kinase (ribokinase family)